MSLQALVFMGLSVVLGATALLPLQVRAAETPEVLAETCIDGWSRTAIPATPATWQAYDIIVEDDQPAWLLGGSNKGPMAFAWQLGAWRSVPVGLGGATALQSGAQAGDGTLWAVGSDRPARGAMRPITGQLTPERWQRRALKAEPSDRAALTGVAIKGTDRAWAVGTKLIDGRTQAYALRWSGSTWQERSPASGKGDSGLTAITSANGSDIWAVGWDQAGSGRLRPLIARLNGSRWSTSDGAALANGIGVLTDVDFPSRREGWAVGYLVPEGSSRHEVMLQRWDGEAWHLEPLPWAADLSAVPRALDVGEGGDVWIAGAVLQEGTGARGFVAHRTDDGWRLHDGILPAGSNSEIASIAALGDGAIAAGELDSVAIVLVTCQPGDAAVAGSGDLPVAGSGGASATAWAPLAGRLKLEEPVEPVGFSITDMAVESGLAAVADTTNGLVADLDADGWTDVLYWNHTDVPHYYLGGPEGFRPGPATAFGPLDRHYCSVADVEADGDLDIFCSSGRRRGRGIGYHELSLDPTAVEGGPVSDIGGAIDPFGRGRAATFIELDGDGLPELYVTTSADRGDAMPGMNRFFRNVSGRFVPAPEVGLDHSTGGWCALAADIDGDGDEDLLHCLDQSDDKRVEGLRIYRNEDGRLRERSARLGLEPMRDVAVLVEDLSGDGRMDIVQLNRNRVRVSLGTAKGFKLAYEAVVPFAVGVAAGDVNGDGRLDLYVVTGSARGNEDDVLLVNEGRGRAFQSVRIPQAVDGSGSGVLAIDYDHNGLDDFVVLNGNGSFQGTTQLLASLPS